MTLTFRNVDADPGSEPDDWPFEGVLAAVERGSLTDWRRLVAAIRAQPWGPCARAVEVIVSWGENGGIDAVLGGWLRRARDEADQATARSVGEYLREVRSELGMSQREFAPLIGTSAQRLSSYETGRVAPSVAILGRVERVRQAGESPRSDSNRRPAVYKTAALAN